MHLFILVVVGMVKGGGGIRGNYLWEQSQCESNWHDCFRLNSYTLFFYAVACWDRDYSHAKPGADRHASPPIVLIHESILLFGWRSHCQE